MADASGYVLAAAGVAGSWCGLPDVEVEFAAAVVSCVYQFEQPVFADGVLSYLQTPFLMRDSVAG